MSQGQKTFFCFLFMLFRDQFSWECVQMLLNKVEVLVNSSLVSEEASFVSTTFPIFFYISVHFTVSVLVCAWIHTLDYLCVCSYGRETVCVWERALYCTCNIELFVNTLPHTHGLLIKKKNNCTNQQRINLFGINLWFMGPLAKLLL